MSGAPPDTAHLPLALRQRMTTLYRQVLPQARLAWTADGESHLWGVPRWVVRAWVLATSTGRDPLPACIDAHLGDGAFDRFGDRPEWAGRDLGRVWVRRLSEIASGIRPAVRP